MKVSICVISRAAQTAAANKWMHDHLNVEGGDNISTPLIRVSDPDDAPVWGYGCYFASLPVGSDKAMRTGIVNSPWVDLWVDVPWDQCLAEKGLRVKPSRVPI